MRTCWCTSGKATLTKYSSRSRRTIRRLISVSRGKIASYGISANQLFATERRLDQEREQLEARRREKDEQHLYLTAKVRRNCQAHLFQIAAPDFATLFRSSPTTHSETTKDTISPPLRKRISLQASFLPSVSSKPSPTLSLNNAWLITSRSRSIRSVCGYW